MKNILYGELHESSTEDTLCIQPLYTGDSEIQSFDRASLKKITKDKGIEDTRGFKNARALITLGKMEFAPEVDISVSKKPRNAAWYIVVVRETKVDIAKNLNMNFNWGKDIKTKSKVIDVYARIKK